MEIDVFGIAPRGEFSVINLLFGIILLIIRKPLFWNVSSSDTSTVARYRKGGEQVSSYADSK